MFPFASSAIEKTRSSREVHKVSGAPSAEIFTTSAPPVVDGKKGKGAVAVVACDAPACKVSVDEFGCPITGAVCCGVSTPLKTGKAGVARCFSPIDAAKIFPFASVDSEVTSFLFVSYTTKVCPAVGAAPALFRTGSIRKIKPSGSVPTSKFPLPSKASDRACRSSL